MMNLRVEYVYIYIFIHTYRRANGTNKLQFAAYGQFVLVI